MACSLHRAEGWHAACAEQKDGMQPAQNRRMACSPHRADRWHVACVEQKDGMQPAQNRQMACSPHRAKGWHAVSSTSMGLPSVRATTQALPNIALAQVQCGGGTDGFTVAAKSAAAAREGGEVSIGISDATAQAAVAMGFKGGSSLSQLNHLKGQPFDFRTCAGEVAPPDCLFSSQQHNQQGYEVTMGFTFYQWGLTHSQSGWLASCCQLDGQSPDRQEWLDIMVTMGFDLQPGSLAARSAQLFQLHKKYPRHQK
eukprot:1159789-Pelagomonas_calceolata.AAC.8